MGGGVQGPGRSGAPYSTALVALRFTGFFQVPSSLLDRGWLQHDGFSAPAKACKAQVKPAKRLVLSCSSL